MKTIDNLIDMHVEITRKEEPIIIRKLEMINALYDECECSEDRIFFDEIINNLADIIEMQKEMIEELKMEAECGARNTSLLREQPFIRPENDEQLQNAFTYYFTYEAKKSLSSYTLNDYCSRLRNLWAMFYEAYEEKDTDLDGVHLSEESFSHDNPLTNIYNNIDNLRFFVIKKSKKSENKKKWANAGAALSKLEEFVTGSKH